MHREERLFVCYVPGLDRRRIREDDTPFLAEFLSTNPSVELKTLPSTELVPTLVTGVWPHEHGIWQVSLKQGVASGAGDRIASLVPDVVSTTVQCFRHLLGDYELAAMPWRRRRHFNMHRFKYPRRRKRELTGLPVESVFDWVGPASRYQFAQHWEDLPRLLGSIPDDGLKLDLLELYAFDITSHWNLDRPEVIRSYLGTLDEFVRQLHGQCEAEGVTFLLLVDHGQERIQRSVNLEKAIAGAGARRGDFHYFIEVGQARLWFKTDDARRRITGELERIEGVRLVSWEDMHEYRVGFPDSAYGELYVIAEPGTGFFPHDFYNPIANLYLGLKDRIQRPRLRSARHRASHGMLPDGEAEKGYLVLADRSAAITADEIELIDFAPTVLALLGVEAPAHLEGRPAFRRANHA